MNTNPLNNISFDNTKYAFEYKSTAELKKARLLFSCMGQPLFIKLGLKIMPFAIKWKLPFIQLIIRKTIFSQFVGGETLQKTINVVKKLEDYAVQVILDYGVEGKEGENAFDSATKEFINVINYASTQHNIPFISIKVTGLSRFSLLKKIESLMMQHDSGSLLKSYSHASDMLNDDEKIELAKVIERLTTICKYAKEKNVAVLIDAEESWIQSPVDAMVTLMMIAFNKEKSIIYNTIQLYRHDRLQFLKNNFSIAQENNFILGVKLVRGAYMEKERLRALEMNYLSPIQKTKEDTDKDYNNAIEFSINNINKIATIIASHNEHSNLLTTQLMLRNNIPFNHPHIHFSQLYGMSDNITFNLAKMGCSVSKYLPFGPIKDVVPYLMRRAQENSSVAGQTGRELGLIKTELKRRNTNNS